MSAHPQGSPVRSPSRRPSQQLLPGRSRRLLWSGSLLLAAVLLTIAVRLQQRYGVLCYGAGFPLRKAERPAPLPRLPWAPLLSEEERQRGISFYGGGARLRAVATKLLGGQPIKAFTLGGSVTYGHGVDDLALSYPSLFFRFINETFPHRDHVLLNRGMPGSTAPVTEPCVAALLAPHSSDPDIVVIELSTNESPAAYTSRGRQAYERLIRRLLRLPSAPAVVLLHHYPWWKAGGEGAPAGLFYREPEGQLSLYSQYYDIPSLSLRSATWRLMQAGIDGFRVDRTIAAGNTNAATREAIPVARPGTERSFFYLDTIHPGPSGHQALAELLAGLVQKAVVEVAAGLVPQGRGGANLGLAGLPPPMAPNYEEQRASLCLQLGDFKAAVKRVQGFEYRAEKPLLPRWIEQKWGYSAVEPGAWAELEVDTRLRDPSACAKGRNATQVLLSHLKSYSGMGSALVECTSGCACAPSVLDGTTPSRVSVFRVHSFKATQHERCRLRVTVRKEPGEVPSQGHKVMFAGVMVTHRVEE